MLGAISVCNSFCLLTKDKFGEATITVKKEKRPVVIKDKEENIVSKSFFLFSGDNGSFHHRFFVAS